jgi:glucose-1-phosphate adenylyltransferase
MHGPLPPAKLVHGAAEEVPYANEALLSPGAVVTGGSVEQSVLSPNVFVEAGAEVVESVLLDDVVVGKGSRVHRAILDKNVVVPEGVEIGVDPEADAKRGLTVRDGLTVLGKGERIPAS